MEKIDNLHVLMITSEWPTPAHPEWAPFLVEQVKRLREAGIEVQVFPYRGSKKPVNYYMARKQLHKEVNLDNYDLIHAQFAQSALLVLPSRLPLVVTYHGSDVLGIVGENGHYTATGRILQFISRYVALVATENIVVSQHMLRYLPKRTYNIIPMGVDLDLFRPIPSFEAIRLAGLSPNNRYILFGANPNVALKRFELAHKAVELIKDSRISLIPLQNIPHERVPYYLNASRVLLLTSLHEGSPTIVKEALACNVPIVSTDVGDVRERIGGIEGCVVCEDDRPETIAAALQQVLSRGNRINGRQAVLDLDERVLTQKVIQVYKQAIEKTKAR